MERINVTIPRRALRVIDAAAERAGTTRSGYLVESAIHQLGIGVVRDPKLPSKKRNINKWVLGIRLFPLENKIDVIAIYVMTIVAVNGEYPFPVDLLK